MNRSLTCILLAISIMLLAVQAIAQNSFAPAGAEWWYQGNNRDFTSGPMFVPNKTWTDHVLVNGDTLINWTNQYD